MDCNHCSIIITPQCQSAHYAGDSLHFTTTRIVDRDIDLEDSPQLHCLDYRSPAFFGGARVIYGANTQENDRFRQVSRRSNLAAGLLKWVVLGSTADSPPGSVL
jgi:hypothetical protein